MRRISILNFKGGVGKTTLTTNLAYALALQGNRVLIIDCDLQANASTLLADVQSPTLTNVLRGEAALAAAIQEARERLHIVPADKDLNTAANHIVASGMKSYYILRNAMKQLQGYDYVLFDHSPSYSPITESALLASQEMLIPCELASFAVQGLLNMLEKLNATLSDLDHELDLCGIVPFKLDMRYSMSHQYLESLKATFGEKILQAIRTDATVPRSQSVQETVFEYDNRSKVAEDFLQLAAFVMQKGQQEVIA